MKVPRGPLVWAGLGAVLGATAVTVVLAWLGPGPVRPASTPPPPSIPAEEVPSITVPAEPEGDPEPEDAFRPVADRPPLLLDDGDRAPFLEALRRSRRWLAAQPPDRKWRYGPTEVPNALLVRWLERVENWLERDLPAEELAARIAEAFEPLESVGGSGDGEVLFTGYYEPVIAGSRTRSADYPVPVLGPPDGMIRVDLGDFRPDRAGERLLGRLAGGRLVPLPDRREARERGLWHRHAIAWARDPVDLFFLEVQGSGALALPDGTEMRIGYAGSNGHRYASIGKLLIDEGHVPREDMSMQAIRAWLAEHPGELHRVLDHNPSLVFFRRLDGPPEGNLGFPVTPGRSIATHHHFVPPGALAWIEVEMPPDLVPSGRLGRFVLNQDTGGAIRGPGRVDLFCGRGPDAAELAGRMKQPGRLVLLAPRRPSRQR